MSMYNAQQAMEIAIRTVKQCCDLTEASKNDVLKKLYAITKSVTKKNWDQKSILEALHKFHKTHGKPPAVLDLSLDELPSGYIITSHFHCSPGTLLRREFPETRKVRPKNIYGFTTEQEWIDCFKEQFNKHLFPGMNNRKYNQIRDKGTPAWETIARNTGYTTWHELMEKAGVKYLGQRSLETAKVLVIKDVDSPLLKKMDKINSERRALNDELLNILQNKRDSFLDVI